MSEQGAGGTGRPGDGASSDPPRKTPATPQWPGSLPSPAPHPSAPPSPYGGQLPWRTGPDDTTWALLAHIGGVFFSFLAPLIILLTKGQQSGFVRDQAAEALNFQLTLIIAYVVSVVLIVVLIGLLLLPVIGVLALVFGILAAIASSRGEAYRYPVNLRLVK